VETKIGYTDRRMMRALALFGVLVLAGIGGVVADRFCVSKGALHPPDGPTLITQVREVARLETLDVTLFKKVSFSPDAVPAGSVWGDLAHWVKASVHPTKGRAIVFAHVQMGLSLRQLDADHLHVHGNSVEVELPPLETRVELMPGDTEVIDSNLSSAETAQLFELAKDGFRAEASADAQLQERARRSAERALRGFLMGVGFHEVRFVPFAPRTAATN
jgi:hypothetical protein